MMNRSIYATLFTFFVACILFSGCGEEQAYNGAIQEASDDFASMVNKTVADPERAVQIIELFNKNHDSYRELYAISQEYHERFKQLNADYDTTPEQFRELYAEHDEEWRVTRNRIVTNLFAMKIHTTEDEWNDLVKQLKKYMNQRIQVEYAK